MVISTVQLFGLTPNIHSSSFCFGSFRFSCFAFLFCFVFSHHFVLSSSILEQPDNNNDTTELGILVIPEISVTNVAGERTGNGEKGRTLGEIDAQHIQGVQETTTDPRTESKGLPEIRRQKSVRKMMEDGINSPGRVQF